MPLSYSIDEKTGVLHWKAVGSTTEEEWEKVVPEVLDLMVKKKPLRTLFDHSEHESLLGSEKMLKLMDRIPTARLGNPRWAILVKDTLHYGVSRQFEQLCELRGLSVRVFKDRGEAEEWLLA
jgi:hypothetical protein